jgi:hypothetical protein
MKTIMIAFGVAILVGLASTALATEPLGTSKHRPVVRDKAISAYAQAPAGRARRSAVQLRPSFTAEEKTLFKRVGHPE